MRVVTLRHLIIVIVSIVALDAFVYWRWGEPADPPPYMAVVALSMCFGALALWFMGDSR